MMMTSNSQMGAWRTDGISQKDAPKIEPILIEAIAGPGRGARATLANGSLTVGSAEGCDLIIKDPAVSRHHAVFELLPGAVKIRDVGSRNGTLYMGARIFEARVPLCGSVRVGRTTLRLAPATSKPMLSERTELHGLVGHSLALQQVFAVLEKLGPTESIVLIQGETGVGKGAVARALHAISRRAEAPFVVFDCTNGNAAALEAELFGENERPGALEAAGEGTLLLDEVGELPLEVQPKLLRVLESREFRRLGESTVRAAKMRILATTQRELEDDTRANRFRTDLYYRIAVAMVKLPPLRERADDIPVLAAHFAQQKLGMHVPLSPATLAALQCDPWRGNVRELRNAVERVLTLGRLDTEVPKDTPLRNPSFKEARDKLVDQFERDYLVALLARYNGNVSAAAREAKLSRTHMYRLLDRHQIDH